MPLVLAITDSDALAGSLCRYFSHTRGVDVRVRRSGVAVPDDAPALAAAVETFADVADWIEQQANGSGGTLPNGVLALIDLPSLGRNAASSDWNPIAPETSPWARVVSMLVLAFPEVHWVLMTPFPSLGDVEPNAGFAADVAGAATRSPHVLTTGSDLKSLLSWSAEAFTPLFDPTGFRQRIRRNIRSYREDVAGEAVADYVPARREASAAIDDEPAYACFSAYAAYRHGYCAHTVVTLGMMRRVFGEDPTAPPTPIGTTVCSCTPAPGRAPDRIALTLEDVYLGFPDQGETSLHLSDLCNRQRRFPGLQRVGQRIFITSDHDRSSPDTTAAKAQQLLNDSHRERLKRLGTKTGRQLKPYSGMFTLWRDSRPDDPLQWKSRVQMLFRKPGSSPDNWQPDRDPNLAAGYEWPPHQHARSTGHSSPGILAVIARHLLDRGRRRQLHVSTVHNAVLGAVMALDAEEYLGHRSPTTAMEALALKHRHEVLAECLFHGVSEDLALRERVSEIDRHLRSIGSWFGKEKRETAVLSAKSSIFGQLVLVFREHHRFDQELACLADARAAATRLRFATHPRQWVQNAAVAYATVVLNRPRNLILAVAIWFSVLAWAFSFTHAVTSEPSWLRGSVHALTSFVGLSPSPDVNTLLESGWLTAWFAAAMLLGVVHFGLFVAHLYAVVSRR